MVSLKGVFEVGLVKNGIPILKINFPELVEFRKINPLLMSGFIQVLNDFIDVEFEEIPEQLQMETFNACFHPIMDPRDENNSLIFYAFCLKNITYFQIRFIFDKIVKRLEKDMKLLFSGSPKESVIINSENVMAEEFEKFMKKNSYGTKLSKF